MPADRAARRMTRGPAPPARRAARRPSSACSAPARWARASRSWRAARARRRCCTTRSRRRSQRGASASRDGLRQEAAKGRLTAEQAERGAARAWRRSTTLDGARAVRAGDRGGARAPGAQARALRGSSRRSSPRTACSRRNTSSLLVTAIAAGASHPERVVGMHFFNPAPVMALLEVDRRRAVLGEAALAIARATGEAMGKTVIRATDGPGFLVNRCNRPFGLEALRLLQERIADVEAIDRICRMEGGFRMGPFELMDLVGVDIGLRDLQELLRAELRRAALAPVADRGALRGGGAARAQDRPRLLHLPERAPHGGRRTGPPPGRPDAREPSRRQRRGRCRDRRRGPAWRSELRHAAGWPGTRCARRTSRPAACCRRWSIECDRVPAAGDEAAAGAQRHARARRRAAPHLMLCAAGSLGALDPGGSAVGFHVLAPLEQGALVELTRNEGSSPLAAARAERFFAALGKHVEWVGDAPGLVLGRIVCQVINECAFALGEGVGERGATSTRAWCSASAIRAARSSGPTRSASTTCSSVLQALRERVRRGALPRGAGAAPAACRGPPRPRQRRRLLRLRRRERDTARATSRSRARRRST